jgi:hypothetical protein
VGAIWMRQGTWHEGEPWRGQPWCARYDAWLGRGRGALATLGMVARCRQARWKKCSNGPSQIGARPHSSTKPGAFNTFPIFPCFSNSNQKLLVEKYKT